MKKLGVLSFLVFLALPLLLWAAMKMPRGTEGSWEGLVSGNHCVLMGMTCPLSHAKEEVGVLIPGKKGKLDYKHFYYFVGLPDEKQHDLFGKEVKVSGTLYEEHSSVLVKNLQVKEGGKWKPFWAMSKQEMGKMQTGKKQKPTSAY